MTIYILQKDLPNCPQGALFEKNCFGNYNCMGSQNIMYDAKYVENNIEWFRLKKEYPEFYSQQELKEAISFTIKNSFYCFDDDKVTPIFEAFN